MAETEILFARLDDLANNARIVLSTPTTFYVSRSGNDSTGDGTVSKPWATRSFAYNFIQANYDLGGQLVTIQLGDTDVLGPYTDGFNAFGPIIGQAGALGLLFKGNVTDPSKCKISPTNGNGFGNAFGAQCSIQGFYFDFSNGNGACDGTGPGDMVTVNGSGSEIWITSPNPGVVTLSCIFGPSGGICYNNLSAAFGGKIFIDTWVKIKIDAAAAAINRTATWTSGAGTITVNDATGLHPGMHVTGTGIYDNEWIAAPIVGTTITLAGSGTFASKTDEPVTFVMAAQTFIDVAVGGQVIVNTNGVHGLVAIEIQGHPFYYGSFILSNGSGAVALVSSIDFSGPGTTGTNGGSATAGPKFTVKTLGTIDTLSNTNDPATYLPGDAVTATASFSEGDQEILISANDPLPYSGTRIYAGNLVLGTGFQNPGRATFATATSEETSVEFLKSVFGTGGNTELRLSRPAVSSQTGVTLTFVGTIGTGGEYN